MSENNAKLNVEWSPVVSNTDPKRTIRLRISDATSNTTVAQVYLTEPDLMQLFSNSIVGSVDGIDGYVLNEKALTTLGRYHRPITARFPVHEHIEDAVRQWADSPVVQRTLPLTHSARIRRTNDGHWRVDFGHFFSQGELDEGMRTHYQSLLDKLAAINPPEKKA